MVVFQCRNPVHRAHYELFMRARQHENVNPDGAVVLVHPTVGPTQADDISGEIRYQTYLVLEKQIKDPTVLFEYLPYSMHMAGCVCAVVCLCCCCCVCCCRRPVVCRLTSVWGRPSPCMDSSISSISMFRRPLSSRRRLAHSLTHARFPSHLLSSPFLTSHRTFHIQQPA